MSCWIVTRCIQKV